VVYTKYKTVEVFLLYRENPKDALQIVERQIFNEDFLK
jgi:hypothetical protein